MLSCLREFPDRDTNINHYRDVHLRTMTYCRPCGRPIGSKKFGNHLMSRRHQSMDKSAASVSVVSILALFLFIINAITFCKTIKHSLSFRILVKDIQRYPKMHPINVQAQICLISTLSVSHRKFLGAFRKFHLVHYMDAVYDAKIVMVLLSIFVKRIRTAVFFAQIANHHCLLN